MRTFQSALDITANNMANVNTTAYKAERGAFQDLLYTQMDVKSGELLTGHGVKMSDVQPVFIQGAFEKSGQPLDFADAALRKNYYSQVQLVFQNAAAAFHPRKSIGSSIMLPMLNYGCTKAAAQERSIALLLAAGLTPQHAEKFPHQLSGGECQRAAIARAISIKPRLLICDEITSALDVQTQAEIIQLLLKLQAETKMSLLFISHDITLVQEICQRILIMQSGTIIESGPALDIITRPQQHYTRELVTAAFNLTKI